MAAIQGGEYDRRANQREVVMDRPVRELPPRGDYLAHEVGRLAGVSGQTIGQWARRGYIRSSQSDTAPRVYSYQDVAEAMVVHELRERETDFREINTTIETLRRNTGNAWPLTHGALGTARGTVVVEDAGGFVDVGRRVGHGLAVTEEDVDRIATDLRRGGWAARDLPGLAHIEVDPDRLSGRPVIRGTRVPAELAAELADRPGGREELRDGYDVSDREIDDAVAWWRAVQAYEQAA